MLAEVLHVGQEHRLQDDGEHENHRYNSYFSITNAYIQWHRIANPTQLLNDATEFGGICNPDEVNISICNAPTPTAGRLHLPALPPRYSYGQNCKGSVLGAPLSPV